MLDFIPLDITLVETCYGTGECEKLDRETIELVEDYYKDNVGIDLRFNYNSEPLQSENNNTVLITYEMVKGLSDTYNVDGNELTMFHGLYIGAYVNPWNNLGVAWYVLGVTGIRPGVKYNQYTNDFHKEKAITIIHEIGHLLNLPHIEDDNNIMYAYAGSNLNVSFNEEQIEIMREDALNKID